MASAASAGSAAPKRDVDLLLDFGGGSGSATNSSAYHGHVGSLSAASSGSSNSVIGTAAAGTAPTAQSLEDLLGLSNSTVNFTAATGFAPAAVPTSLLPSSVTMPGMASTAYRPPAPLYPPSRPAGFATAAYPSAMAGYPAPVAGVPTLPAATGAPRGSVTFDPSLVGRGRDAPNYTVSSTSSDARASSSSSFAFVGEKRDAFEFVQDEIRRK